MAKVEDYGVLLVTKPLNKMMFYQTLKLANATRKRILGFKSENVKADIIYLCSPNNPTGAVYNKVV